MSDRLVCSSQSYSTIHKLLNMPIVMQYFSSSRILAFNAKVLVIYIIIVLGNLYPLKGWIESSFTWIWSWSTALWFYCTIINITTISIVLAVSLLKHSINSRILWNRSILWRTNIRKCRIMSKLRIIEIFN